MKNIFPPEFGERGFSSWLNWCIDTDCDRNLGNWLLYRNELISFAEKFVNQHSGGSSSDDRPS